MLNILHDLIYVFAKYLCHRFSLTAHESIAVVRLS